MSLPEAASQQFGGVVPARRQDPSAVRTKLCPVNDSLMLKGGDEFAGGRIPELGGFVPACRQDPSAVRTKLRIVDLALMSERRRSACRRSHPRAWRFCLCLPSGSECRPD